MTREKVEWIGYKVKKNYKKGNRIESPRTEKEETQDDLEV